MLIYVKVSYANRDLRCQCIQITFRFSAPRPSTFRIDVHVPLAPPQVVILRLEPRLHILFFLPSLVAARPTDATDWSERELTEHAGLKVSLHPSLYWKNRSSSGCFER